MYSNGFYILSPSQEVECIKIDINGITSFVPLDPANTDYAAIMALVEAGELTIAPAEEPSK